MTAEAYQQASQGMWEMASAIGRIRDSDLFNDTHYNNWDALADAYRSWAIQYSCMNSLLLGLEPAFKDRPECDRARDYKERNYPDSGYWDKIEYHNWGELRVKYRKDSYSFKSSWLPLWAPSVERNVRSLDMVVRTYRDGRIVKDTLFEDGDDPESAQATSTWTLGPGSRLASFRYNTHGHSIAATYQWSEGTYAGMSVVDKRRLVGVSAPVAVPAMEKGGRIVQEAKTLEASVWINSTFRYSAGNVLTYHWAEWVRPNPALVWDGPADWGGWIWKFPEGEPGWGPGNQVQLGYEVTQWNAQGQPKSYAYQINDDEGKKLERGKFTFSYVWSFHWKNSFVNVRQDCCRWDETGRVTWQRQAGARYEYDYWNDSGY